jgi:AcrR family transcriptional regulator
VQAARRARALAAARGLAERGGYGAVTMDAVAERSGIARATLYRYFASKDHMLGEVTLGWGGEIVARLRVRPPRGRTAGARVGEVFARVIEIAAAHPRLTEASVAAALSEDPSAAAVHQGAVSLVGAYIDSAMGMEAREDRDTLARVLGHVFLSVLIQLTRGRASRAEAEEELRGAARLLLDRGRA